jgi:hypothetical protein
MPPNDPQPGRPGDDPWLERQHYWKRKLGRIRLGAEPVEEQVARYRRVTWMLTAVPVGLALMFVGLFTAFRRPDVGGILALVLFLPVVVVAWVDFTLLRRRVAAYLREREAHTRGASHPGRT